jgi:peptidoglycan/xylan/chitin deacetylase (PgdA/CDA1 family)
MTLAVLYHDIIEPGRPDASGFPGPGAARYKLTVAQFREHLRALTGASSLPLRGGGTRRGEAASLPLQSSSPAGEGEVTARPQLRAPELLLTFDDGGVSAVAIADLLEEQDWRGYFLITTDFIGVPSFLSAAQIRDLRQRGHVLGSHSCSHPPRMARCCWEQLVAEWTHSRAVLADILGEPVTVASVPGGYYSRRVAEAADRAGIRLLFNSEPTTRTRRVGGCLVIGRYTIYEGMTAADAAALVGRRPWRRLRQTLAWKLKKVAKVIGGQGYLALRECLLKRRYPTAGERPA